MRLTAFILLLVISAAAAAPTQAQIASPHTRLGDRQCSNCHTSADNWKAISFAHEATRYTLRGQHRVAPCEGCHDLKDFASVSGTCQTCHEDPHRGDAGTRCEGCHTESAWRDIDAPQAHARTRLPDLGVHSALRCDDCHRKTGNRPFTSPVTPCVGCHMGTYTATVNPAHQTIGFSTRCDECHQLSTWNFAVFSQHDAIFPIYTETHAHTWPSCASCHPVANDFKQFSCTNCHTQGATSPRHQGITDYQWTSVACRSCHPTGRPGLVNHDAIFPINAGVHQGVWQGQCTACHIDPNSRLVFSCMTSGCHVQAATDVAHNGLQGYGYTAAQCYACHPDGRAGIFTQHDPIFPIFSGTHASKWNGACASCHPTAGNRAVFTCMSAGCHAQPATDAFHNHMATYAYTPAPCLACHPDGRRGIYTAHDPFFPIYSGTHRGRWASCASCHQVSGVRTTFNCVGSGCHSQTSMDSAHRGRQGYTGTPANCLSCHPTGRNP